MAKKKTRSKKNPKSYGQFCPVAKAAEIFAERWTPLVLRELISGSHRFSDVQRGVPLMSPSLLSRRLKELVEAGVVEKRKPRSGSNFFTAWISPRLPSSIKSSNGKPRFR